jgi:RimJ/RimL family protein N-acetyltransferase
MTSSRDERAPVLETERLILREQAVSDLDAAHAIWSEPAVFRFIGGKPRPRDEVWRRILANAGSWSLLGFGSWSVVRKSDGALAGLCGFLDAQREMTPPFGAQDLEAGWVMRPDMQGQGLASEAMQAALAWAEVKLPERTAVCIIHPDNAPSIRLAQRCGFSERARTTYLNEPTIQFERRRRHG